MPKKKSKVPDTIITLTLPTPEDGGIASDRAEATLLIQRGELAHVRQFHYQGMLDDLYTAIREASEALDLLEDNPPTVPDLPEEKAKSSTKAKTASDEEPTIEIPLKKGSKQVKIRRILMRHLKIIGGESDAAAYRQAVMIAGKRTPWGESTGSCGTVNYPSALTMCMRWPRR